MGMRRMSILRMSLLYFAPENSSISAATSGGRPSSFDDVDFFSVLDIPASSALVGLMASDISFDGEGNDCLLQAEQYAGI